MKFAEGCAALASLFSDSEFFSAEKLVIQRELSIRFPIYLSSFLGLSFRYKIWSGVAEVLHLKSLSL